MKVRAFNDDKNSFVSAKLIELENMEIIDERGFDLSWLTGLKDKNGDDIYEGDILQPSSYTKSEFARCTVVFKKGMFCFDISRPFITSINPLSASLSRGKSSNNGFVVIGNIYQNPELIENNN